MANCLWNDFEGHTKLHLANWKMICKKRNLEVLESLIWVMLICACWALGLKDTSKMMVRSGKTL
jgi:hypothetical protein